MVFRYIYLGGIFTIAAFSAGCAGSLENSQHRRLAEMLDGSAEPIIQTEHEKSELLRVEEIAARGRLSGYIAVALEKNPQIRAAFEQWRAGVYRISKARRLPEPTLGFGYFIRSIETRVGPQQARISLQQTFPWPTKLTAGADAACARARASQSNFEALGLEISKRVTWAYWDLWQVRRIRSIHTKHLEVLRDLAESMRARISTGAAMLADLQQVDLSTARLADDIRSMGEDEIGRQALLRSLLGIRSVEYDLATVEPPIEAHLPADDLEGLARAAEKHPKIARLGYLAEAARLGARVEAADRYPSFSVGMDWIITDESSMPDVPDHGKDAVLIGVGLRLPLWQGSYTEGIAAAQADARAQQARKAALVVRVHAEVTRWYSRVRDAVHRVNLYRTTLVPQAESVYESVLGAYAVGRGGIAQVLLAQRDVLELNIELDRARADYARAWARLEELTGREVRQAPKGG